MNKLDLNELLSNFKATNQLLLSIAEKHNILNAVINDDDCILQDIIDNNNSLIDCFKNYQLNDGWIGVDDDLPPNGTECFVLVDEYDLNKANQAQPSLVEYVRWKNRYFNRIDKTIYKDDHFVCDEKSEVKVTHWFLIPPNPLKE